MINVASQQYEQLQKAQAENKSKNVTYDRIPQQVADSQSDWWINQRGQYEWTPVTAADKAQLDEINKYRRSTGVTERTTLITGAAWSDEYAHEWQSKSGSGISGTGEANVKKRDSSGNVIQTYGSTPDYAPVGSGDVKLSEMRESSSINANASAVTGTAQDKQATVVPAAKPVSEAVVEQPMSDRLPAYGMPDWYEKPVDGDYKEWYDKADLKAVDLTPEKKAVVAAGFGTPDNSEVNRLISDARAANKTTADYDSAFFTTIHGSVGKVTEIPDTLNKKGAEKLSFTPSGETVRQKWDTTLEKQPGEYGYYGYDDLIEAVGSKKAADTYRSVDTDITKGIQDFSVTEYDEFREKPASKAIEYGAYYAGGAALGGAMKGVKIVSKPASELIAGKVAHGTIKTIGAVDNPVLKKAVFKTGSAVAGSIESGAVIDYAMGGMLAAEAVKTTAKGYAEGGAAGATKNVLEMGTMLAIGAPGYKKGDAVIGKLVDGDLMAVVPLVKSAKISEMKGSGADITPSDLTFGQTIAFRDTPLITRVSGEGVKLGAPGAPSVVVEGKTTQAFSKLETRFFEKTVKENAEPVEAEYLQSALNIVRGIDKAGSVPTRMESFEITSRSVPEAMRPAIKDAITSYKGEVVVSGSVPMKAQADPFVSRTPHDLELYADSEHAIVSHVVKTLEARGFKEGVDFKNTGSKLEFKVKDEKTATEVWDTGIEAFTHGKEKPRTVKEIEEAFYNVRNKQPSETDSPKPIAGKSELAFGYESRKPVSIEGGKVKVQDIREQAARKIAGSTFFRGGKLQPAHAGRIKDTGDVITMGTAFAVKGKAPIERDVVAFTEASFKKWGTEAGQQTEFSKAFQQKVANDPVVDFIHRNKRLPTEAELKDIGKELPEIMKPEILYKKGKQITEHGRLINNKSPSPAVMQRFSPSPTPIRRGESVYSPSPTPTRRSPSPNPVTGPSPGTIYIKASPSPAANRVTVVSPALMSSPSPRVGSFVTSQSPGLFSVGPSQRPFTGSPSGRPVVSPSPSPVISPSPHMSPVSSPSPSPFKGSPSPSISPSPSPSRMTRAGINDPVLTMIPGHESRRKSVIPGDATRFGARLKKHYVKDPAEFVLGTKKRGSRKR